MDQISQTEQDWISSRSRSSSHHHSTAETESHSIHLQRRSIVGSAPSCRIRGSSERINSRSSDSVAAVLVRDATQADSNSSGIRSPIVGRSNSCKPESSGRSSLELGHGRCSPADSPVAVKARNALLSARAAVAASADWPWRRQLAVGCEKEAMRQLQSL